MKIKKVSMIIVIALSLILPSGLVSASGTSSLQKDTTGTCKKLDIFPSTTKKIDIKRPDFFPKPVPCKSGEWKAFSKNIDTKKLFPLPKVCKSTEWKTFDGKVKKDRKPCSEKRGNWNVFETKKHELATNLLTQLKKTNK